MLTKDDIIAKKIVKTPQLRGQRETTYDATVGEIIFCGRRIQESSFVLPSRGVVWVVSAEDFEIPADVTGLATLRTTWTHDGVLALNVGVIDPGWQGPVATALVNFSKNDFEVKKGEQFFRILFADHPPSNNPRQVVKLRPEYIDEIVRKSKAFSSEFLNMDSLKNEVAKIIFKLPTWAIGLALAAIIISILAIYMPIAWSVGAEHFQSQARVERLEKEIDDLKKAQDEIRKKQVEIQKPISSMVPEEALKNPKSP